MTLCTVGLDVGGTKIAGGLVAFPQGQVLVRQVVPTRPERGGEAVLADALALAESLVRVASDQALPLAGVGVGVCELVDLEGNVTSGHAVDWKGKAVRAAFSPIAPAWVESDVRAAALAEALFGAGQPYRFMAYVTIGTGISSCLVQDGRPYAGAHGNALVLASSPWTVTCHHCGTKINLVVEDFASGPALVVRYQQIGRHAVSRSEDVLALARAGDPDALEVVRSAGEAVGNVIGFLVNVVDPQAVIIGGGLGTAGGAYWDSLKASAYRHIWGDIGQGLPIVPAGLGAEAGLIGAAATAWRHFSSSKE